MIESAGRAYPVETRYLGRDPRLPIERQVGDAVARALRGDAGSALVFLPGAAEIRRTEALLKERIDDPSVEIVPLYGALDRDVQDRAIAPAPAGTPQGRAGDVDRGDLDHHRGRAYRGRLQAWRACRATSLTSG